MVELFSKYRSTLSSNPVLVVSYGWGVVQSLWTKEALWLSQVWVVHVSYVGIKAVSAQLLELLACASRAVVGSGVVDEAALLSDGHALDSMQRLRLRATDDDCAERVFGVGANGKSQR